MTVGRSKCVVHRGERGNTHELKFRETYDDMILMPVVTLAGQIMKPLVVLPGFEVLYRKRPNGKYETASDYLPKPNYLLMIPVAGVEIHMFRRGRRDLLKLLLVMDEYAIHVSFRTFLLL